MSWRLINRLVFWLGTGPIAAYVALLTLVALIAQTRNPDAKALLDNQVTMWVAIRMAAYVWYWVFAIVVIWTTAFVWTDQKAREQEAADRPSYRDIYELLVAGLPRQSRASVTPDSATQSVSSTSPTVTSPPAQEISPSLF